MSDFQKVIFTGNLGKDPEMRYTPSGQAVTSFSVASNREYATANGERAKETTWFRVSVWGKLAETCNQYLKKGSKVLIDGRLTPDKSTGAPRIWKKQDGSVGTSNEVTAMSVTFLSPRSESNSMTEAAQEIGGQELPPEDDIPF